MSQIDLFTKRKARKPRPASELATHCAIADTLRVSLTPGWIWWHTPNGGYRTVAEAGRFKRMGVMPGISDFLLLSPDGRLHALELKARHQKPTEEQIAFLMAVHGRGCRGEWVDSYEAAIAALKDWGAVRVKI